jgi:phosphoenolpyruvate carboxylase
VGGDRDGNPSITPSVTMQVLEMQHEHGLRKLVEHWSRGAEELSTSTRIRAVTSDLAASLEEDRELLPTCGSGSIDSTPASRTASNAPTSTSGCSTPANASPRVPATYPARTTRAPVELLTDLELMRLAGAERRGADRHGTCCGLQRNARCSDSTSPPWTSASTPNAPRGARPAVRRLDIDYAAARPGERRTLLADELANRRPLSPVTTNLHDRAVATFGPSVPSARPSTASATR